MAKTQDWIGGSAWDACSKFVREKFESSIGIPPTGGNSNIPITK